MNCKKWSILTISLALGALIVLGAMTVVVDPYFHFHAPQKWLQYPIHNQRYQNDGILRNFDYDAILTGTSITENFKTSEFDKLFGTNSVKVSCAGAYLRETAERLERGLSTHPHTRYVVQSLDVWALLADKDMLTDFDYPNYLYDDNLCNDVNYIFNKNVFVDYTLRTIGFTRLGDHTTTFDAYSNWSDGFAYGADAIKWVSTRYAKTDVRAEATQAQIQSVVDNVRQNITAQAARYPDTEFYCFIPPMSLFEFDNWNQMNVLYQRTCLMEAAVRELMACENIHVFSFLDAYDVNCNADNFRDPSHYGEWINSFILESMKKGDYELTTDNYQQHFRDVEAFYSVYDYDSLYA